MENVKENKKNKKIDISKKQFWITMFIILIFALCLFFGKSILNFANAEIYLKKDNITEEMKNNIDSYKLIENKYYFVYMYDKKNCGECTDYSLELKKYEKETGFKIFKVNLNDLKKDMVESNLFIDSKNPYLIVIKDGVEDYRYVGKHSIDILPTNK